MKINKIKRSELINLLLDKISNNEELSDDMMELLKNNNIENTMNNYEELQSESDSDQDLKIRLLKKTYSIIKSNIDANTIKDEIYTISTDGEASLFIRCSIRKHEYGAILKSILDAFVTLEWYEECAEVKKYLQIINN